MHLEVKAIKLIPLKDHFNKILLHASFISSKKQVPCQLYPRITLFRRPFQLDKHLQEVNLYQWLENHRVIMSALSDIISMYNLWLPAQQWIDVVETQIQR